jgi:hypothetical protein
MDPANGSAARSGASLAAAEALGFDLLAFLLAFLLPLALALPSGRFKVQYV